MIVIVCGSIEVTSLTGLHVRAMLTGLQLEHPGVKLYHGGNPGVDRLADMAAADLGIPVRIFPLDRKLPEPEASTHRNTLMVNTAIVDGLFDGTNVFVLAFKENFDHTLASGSVERLCLNARQANIPVVVIERLINDYSDHSTTTSEPFPYDPLC